MTIDDLKARSALKFMMQFAQFHVTAVNFHSRLDGQVKFSFVAVQEIAWIHSLIMQ